MNGAFYPTLEFFDYCPFFVDRLRRIVAMKHAF